MSAKSDSIIPASFEIGAIITSSWEVCKAHWGIILGAMIVMQIFSMGISFTCEMVATAVGDQTVGMVLILGGQFVSIALSCWLQMGMVRILLDCVDDNNPNFGDLFSQGRHLMTFVGAIILCGLMVVLGFICLIVPGIIVFLMFSQYSYLIVDRDMGAIESLKASARITKGVKGELFVLGLACFVIMVLGALACCVGLLWAGPLVALVMTVAYRVLSTRLDDPNYI